MLHSFKYGESKIIVDLLTEWCGRMSCIATLSKSNKGKLKKQYFQPLTLLEVVTVTKPHVQLAQLKEARVNIPFVSIPFHPYKLSIALFTAEFLRLATKNEQTDPLIFNYAINSIEWLDRCTGSVANFHLVFMMRLSRFLGFYPNMEIIGKAIGLICVRDASVASRLCTAMWFHQQRQTTYNCCCV